MSYLRTQRRKARRRAGAPATYVPPAPVLPVHPALRRWLPVATPNADARRRAQLENPTRRQPRATRAQRLADLRARLADEGRVATRGDLRSWDAFRNRRRARAARALQS